MKRYLVRISLPFLLIGVLIAHIAGYLEVPYIDALERLTYDSRLRLYAPRGVDKRIVIIAIDEHSLDKEGHWPWTRDKLSTLVRQLFGYGAAVVGFDSVFAERDESADVDLLRQLARRAGEQGFVEQLDHLAPQLDRDRMFADALATGPTVLGYYFDTDPDTAFETGELPYPAFEVSEEAFANMHLPRAYGYGANLPELIETAYGAGFINNPLVDPDGVIRRAPLLHLYGQEVYEALSLAVAAAYLNDITLPVFVDEKLWMEDYPPLESLELAGTRIPIDAEGAVLVPYRGPAGSFPYISATAVLNGTLSRPELLDGAIALVGATAPGLQDIRSTPFGSVYPGVEVHANVIAGILDEKFHWQPAYTVALEMISVLVFGLMSALILPVLSPVRASIQTLLIFAAALLLNYYLWTVQFHVLPLATTIVTIFGIYVLNMVFGYFFETRTQAQMNELFGQYVPPDLVREMAHDPENYSLASQRRDLSVLFTDIRGFTAISESLDAARLSDMLNQYLTPMTRIIHDRHGTIDKYMGDAVMAFWGAPVDDPAHATHAIDAGLEMQKALVPLNESFAEQGLPHIRIGVGINSGEMSVGNMGSRFRRAYTVLGDAVNLASRLEGLTKGYGVGVIVGEDTRQHAPEFTYREIDRVRVKGKQRPVSIYQPLGRPEELDEEQGAAARRFEQMLAAYRARQWDEAEPIARELLAGEPEAGLYALYLERISAFREDPPGPDWDGVFVHQSK